MLKGLILSVYKSPRIGDCTGGGITSKADQVVVVGYMVDGKVVPLPRDCQVFEPGPDSPAVVLVKSHIARLDPTPHLIPLEIAEDGLPSDSVGPMAGGNYAGTSDSRWAELGKLFGNSLRLDLVAVHDRVETYRDYLSLSM